MKQSIPNPVPPLSSSFIITSFYCSCYHTNVARIEHREHGVEPVNGRGTQPSFFLSIHLVNAIFPGTTEWQMNETGRKLARGEVF